MYILLKYVILLMWTLIAEKLKLKKTRKEKNIVLTQNSVQIFLFLFSLPCSLSTLLQHLFYLYNSTQYKHPPIK